MLGEQVDPDVPSLGPPVLSELPKRLWPGRWWRLRWTWRPRGSAPQSSSSRQPPVYKRRNATANKHTVTGLLKQKKKNQRGLLCRQDKHVIQKYFETEECWNANWEVEGGRGWGGEMIHAVQTGSTTGAGDPAVRLTGSVWALAAPLTLGLVRGLSCSSFLAAASMAAAAPSSSFSAMTVGSSGSTHSVPAAQDTQFSQHYCRPEEEQVRIRTSSLNLWCYGNVFYWRAASANSRVFTTLLHLALRGRRSKGHWASGGFLLPLLFDCCRLPLQWLGDSWLCTDLLENFSLRPPGCTTALDKITFLTTWHSTKVVNDPTIHKV